ncbi:MAG TPA: hypothetical protein VHK27_04590 [Gammaproteobacteria bacterium]|nr:hypothetical protein [Gammaproteobacteria bacterium]
MREFDQLVPQSQTAPGALSPEEIGLLPEVYNYLAVLHNEDRPETRFRRHLAMEEAKRLELEKAQHQLETHRKDVLSMCEQADQYLRAIQVGYAAIFGVWTLTSKSLDPVRTSLVGFLITLSAFTFGFWEYSKASIVAKAVDDHRHISAATLSSSWNVEPPLYFVRDVWPVGS